MNVASVFEFRFPTEVSEEGFGVARAIGADMPGETGYLDHSVIRDLQDPRRVLVITHWVDQDHATAVLSHYANDPKVRKATELIGQQPDGFVGEIDAKA